MKKIIEKIEVRESCNSWFKKEIPSVTTTSALSTRTASTMISFGSMAVTGAGRRVVKNIDTLKIDMILKITFPTLKSKEI